MTGLKRPAKMCGWLLLWVIFLQAQNLQVSNIVPFAARDSLRVDFSLLQLWEDKIARTLLAGIPLDIRIAISLLNAEQQMVVQRSFNGQIVYDVWEEKFSLQDLDFSPASFNQFSDLKNWFSTIKNVGITPIDRLLPNVRYQLRIDLAVIILNRKQNQELKRWMQSADQTEEEFASNERSTGFRLNLNQLVQLLFSGNEKQEEFQAVGLSTSFTLEELILK